MVVRYTSNVVFVVSEGLRAAYKRTEPWTSTRSACDRERNPSMSEDAFMSGQNGLRSSLNY